MFRIYVEIRLNISKLRDETIEIYLSIIQCARSRPLSDPLKWDQRIGKYYNLKSIKSVTLDLRQATTY